MSLPSATSLTAAEILAGAHRDLDRELASAGALDDAAGRHPRIGRTVWEASYKELATVVLRLLDLDIGTVMIEGWLKVRELREAADRTRGTSQRAVVGLAGKTLTLVQHPRVQVVLLDSVVKELVFDVRVDVEVIDLSAVVADGSLVALSAGECTASVGLGLGGAEPLRAAGRSIRAWSLC